MILPGRDASQAKGPAQHPAQLSDTTLPVSGKLLLTFTSRHQARFVLTRHRCAARIVDEIQLPCRETAYPQSPHALARALASV